MKKLLLTLAVVTAFTARIATAQTTFQAILLGSNENPTNNSTATGFGTVVLNAAQTQITVDESWSGLTGGAATASHIHGPAGPGTNASVLFPFSGVPSATSGSIPTQTFSITALQVSQLFAGLYYMNVHDNLFPGGEIRGQLLQVPEPTAMAVAGLGIAGFAVRAWRKRLAKK
jgi:hypothetical protein